MSLIACVGFNQSMVVSNLSKALGSNVCNVQIERCYEGLSKHEEIDLILLAHDPQQVDQFSDIRQIKQINPSIPIVLAVKKHVGNVALKALRSRVWDIVCFPGDIQYLKSRIKELICTRRKHSEISCREIVFPDQLPLDKYFKNQEIKKTVNAITYIENHYNQTIRVKDLSTVCGLNQEKFSKYFKSEQGCTSREYIKIYRMETAKRLLKQTPISIEQIAFATGFETVSLFNRLFRQFVGHTPSFYRSSV